MDLQADLKPGRFFTMAFVCIVPEPNAFNIIGEGSPGHHPVKSVWRY